jgi:hypothetical protein
MTFHRSVTLFGAIVFGALGAGAQTRAKKADSPDVKEIRDFRLNMDIVQKYIRSFQIASTDPAAKKCFDKNPPGNAPTLDDGEKLMNACPAALADLKTAGIKPREFLVVTAALIGDFMAVGLKKSGTIKEYPDSISAENAAFVEQNFDKLQSMLAPLTGDRK